MRILMFHGLMNNDMKKNLIILIMFFLPILTVAQKDYKLVEQNPSKKPSWMTEGTGKGVFMVQANKMASLEEAQNAVMSSLLNSIASSISVHVTSETVDQIDWEVVELDGKTREEYIQTIETNTTLKIAKMPALQGISLSKAEVYWERYVHKKTKESYYDYYILYQFSGFDLQELIEAYNEQEKAINDKIDNYKNVLPEIDDIDVLLENVSHMKAMKEEYKDDYAKCSKLEATIAAYDKTIKDIYIEVVEIYNNDNKGSMVIQLMHGEKIMNTKSLPQLRSECARDFNRRHSGCQVVVTFNTFDCYEQDDNYVEIRYSLGKKKIIHKVNISM